MARYLSVFSGAGRAQRLDPDRGIADGRGGTGVFGCAATGVLSVRIASR